MLNDVGMILRGARLKIMPVWRRWHSGRRVPLDSHDHDPIASYIWYFRGPRDHLTAGVWMSRG